MDEAIYHLHQGHLPLLVSVPHNGTVLPPALAQRLTQNARRVPDTDWHIARLYGFAQAMGASLLVPNYSRYVVDLNRPSDDVSLYPGQNTTGLCPITGFDGVPIYLSGQEPDAEEINQRVQQYWQPYHQALQQELARLCAQHGQVLLWEGHSIRGQCAFLFEGRLPDLNLGTADGASCAPRLQQAVEACMQAQNQYDFVSNGRFKGGYITRHYGVPAQGVHAMQLEISQRNYMDEDSFEWDQSKAWQLQQLLEQLLDAALAAL